MAKSIIGLSQADVKVLKQWIAEGKNAPRSTAVRTPLDMQWTEGMDGGSGEFYIVVADQTIDAYEPGSSVIQSGWCRPLRKRINLSTLEEYLTETGERVRVFNTLTSPINAGDVLTIGKEKFGVWAPMGGGGSAGIWAVVVDKVSYETFQDDELVDIRGKYTCIEVEWLDDGTWQLKPAGRTFTRCYEASTSSNANIQRTRTNIVQLWRVNPVTPSASSFSSFGSSIATSSGVSSSSSNIDDGLYMFDKALGNIFKPKRV